SGSQQSPKLVGEKVRAAGAINLHTVVQLLYAVLDISAVAVDLLVQMARGSLQVGDHEARVVLRFAPIVLRDFCLDDDPAFAFLPALGSITRLSKDVRCL